MNHFTSEELVSVLKKIRNSIDLTSEEAETIKMYIPLHLNSEQAEEMTKLVEAIRSGKRAPLSHDEKINMHRKNMEQSLKNIQQQIPEMTDQQFTETCNMCELLRYQTAKK